MHTSIGLPELFLVLAFTVCPWTDSAVLILAIRYISIIVSILMGIFLYSGIKKTHKITFQSKAEKVLTIIRPAFWCIINIVLLLAGK